MEIPSVRNLKEEAQGALRRARDPKKVILTYTGITIGLSALLTVLNAWLSNRIDGTGGLGNFGIRSVLSTAQSVLPMIQTVVLMCLEFGYLHAVMRLARGQYADHTDLKIGFRKFGPVLRLNILTAFRFGALAFVIFYGSVMIYTMTPWSEPLVEILLPLMESAGTAVDATVILDAATLSLAYDAMLPMFGIFLALYSILAIPMYYRLRMSTYLLLDDPNGRALQAMRQSTQMMRGNKFRLFKLDISFWWYHALTVLASVISYGDVWLPMLGVELPFNETIAFYLFYFIYLAMLFGIYYFLRNGVEVSYVKAYDSLVEKPRDNGVVLGNIFDL